MQDPEPPTGRVDATKGILEGFRKKCFDLATGTKVPYEDWEEARNQVLAVPELLPRLPAWISRCRWGSQYWAFIKGTSPTYQGRREFLWAEFGSLFDFVERGATEPTALSFEGLVENCSSPSVLDAWLRIYSRRDSDPEAAITAARALLESVCKYLLDRLGGTYSTRDDLPKLYRATAKAMNLSPEGHREQLFKKILTGCSSVVGGLAEIRNFYGDAHGKGTAHIKPSPRHADLGINLAGAISTFLIATYEERYRK